MQRRLVVGRRAAPVADRRLEPLILLKPHKGLPNRARNRAKRFVPELSKMQLPRRNMAA